MVGLARSAHLTLETKPLRDCSPTRPACDPARLPFLVTIRLCRKFPPAKTEGWKSCRLDC